MLLLVFWTYVTVYRILYWTDWGSLHAGIYRSSLTNPVRQTLVTAGLVWPNALAIDFTGTVLNLTWTLDGLIVC